jgi:diguanylate cyclase (GGDEF)-like protein
MMRRGGKPDMTYDAARQPGRPGRLAEQQVRRHRPVSLEPLLKAALQSALPGLILLDAARRVRLVTRGAAAMLGLPEAGRDAGTPIMRLLARSFWLDQPALQTLAVAFRTSDGLAPRKILLTLPHPAGARVVALDLRAAGDEGFTISLTDLTDSQETQEFLLDQASCDPVTGLWNRQHFMLMLRDRLDGPRAGGTAVLMLDLKRFRQVIESQGTEAGDMLLLLVGKRLSSFLRDDDLLARFTSDTFAIMAAGMEDHAALEALSVRIADLIARPFLIEGHLITTGATMGVACAPQDGDGPEVLVANAGLALSAARAEAHGQLRFFEPRLNERARHRRSLEADLRLALAHGEFEVHYQPQINMQTRRADGCEALVRWRCPQRGLVSPAEFIPIAEDIGMIGDLGEWVLRQACREACTWPDDITVAVNASPLQMEAPDFAARVAGILAQTGLPGMRLEIEITENLLLHNGPAVVATLAALRALGIRLVLDDFGTGFASLSQLARFHFDRIKIDRSFVSGPDVTADHAVIVRAIAALGLSLGVPTTAEGVETEQQLEQVRDAGCTSVQGYYFSRPVQAADLPHVLGRRHLPRAPALAESQPA